MPVERSAGAVVFRETKPGRTYLILRHAASTKAASRAPAGGHWSFPKGHIEKGEETQAAVRREIKEETGLSQIEFTPGFKETIRYFVNYEGERRLKFVAFFLARVRRRERVKISWEHQAYAWLPYEKAYERLTYSSDKSVLKKAEQFLRNAK